MRIGVLKSGGHIIAELDDAKGWTADEQMTQEFLQSHCRPDQYVDYGGHTIYGVKAGVMAGKFTGWEWVCEVQNQPLPPGAVS